MACSGSWSPGPPDHCADFDTASMSSPSVSSDSARFSKSLEWRSAAALMSSFSDDASDASAFCSRTWTSTVPSPSRAIGEKASSNMSSILISGISSGSKRGLPSSLPSVEAEPHSVNSRRNLPMMSMAVPASLTAGDSARLAISDSAFNPKRGSSSYTLLSPTWKASVSADGSMSELVCSASHTYDPSGLSGVTNEPGSDATRMHSEYFSAHFWSAATSNSLQE